MISGAAGDGFGNSVSVKGSTLVVGSSFADNNGTNAGSAYLFELDGCGTWRKQARLSGEAAGDEFGNAVAMSSDGYLRLIFNDCNSGLVEYDIYTIGQQGVVPIQRVANDNIVICEALK